MHRLESSHKEDFLFSFFMVDFLYYYKIVFNTKLFLVKKKVKAKTNHISIQHKSYQFSHTWNLDEDRVHLIHL